MMSPTGQVVERLITMSLLFIEPRLHVNISWLSAIMVVTSFTMNTLLAVDGGHDIHGHRQLTPEHYSHNMSSRQAGTGCYATMTLRHATFTTLVIIIAIKSLATEKILAPHNIEVIPRESLVFTYYRRSMLYVMREEERVAYIVYTKAIVTPRYSRRYSQMLC